MKNYFIGISLEKLTNIINESKSFKEAVKKLGLNINWRIRDALKSLCDKNKISYMHFYSQSKEDYEKTPKLCKHCGKPIPWEKRENEYCSRSCSTSENNKNIIRNPEGNNGTYKSIKIKICPICGQENCNSEFCNNHNIQQINGFVEHLGFDKTKIGTPEIISEYNRIRNLVSNLYWNEKKSLSDLGTIFNYSKNYMPGSVLDHLEIKRRDLSSAQQAFISTHPDKILPPSNELFSKSMISGNHVSWEGKQCYLRSSYELDYAKYLDSNQISYSVEELRIEYFDSQQNKTRVAVPDFYLSSTNEIIEIKSDFTLDIQEMLDKFEAYKNLGYIPKLILEKEEIDLYNIEKEVEEKRLNRIKYKNLRSIRG